jgi:hypothetical protein
VIVGLSVAFLVACWSDHPLDSKPQVPVDKKLLGTWWCGEDDDRGRLKVKARDDLWYEVTALPPKKKAEHYLGFASIVGGQTVINLKAAPPIPEGWDHPWTFMAVEASGDLLHRRLVTENLLTGREQSPEEVRKTLEEAMARGKAFDDDAPCSRSKAPRH